MDPYPDEIQMTPELMECKSFDDSNSLLAMLNNIVELKKSEPEKYILLTGNHTDSYIWTSFNRATRTDNKNYKKYHKFFLENLDYFNLAYVQGNVIFSHAGITEKWAQEVWNHLEFPKDELSSVIEIATMLQDTKLKDVNKDYLNLLGMVPFERGGWGDGSCEWADIKEHIEKITDYEKNSFIGKGEEGIFQVFGHTQLRSGPLICNKWACIDCRKGFIVDTNTHECKACI